MLFLLTNENKEKIIYIHSVSHLCINENIKISVWNCQESSAIAIQALSVTIISSHRCNHH